MSATGLSTEQDFALKTFRRELESSGILYDGDSIGSDDDTLLYGLIQLPQPIIADGVGLIGAFFVPDNSGYLKQRRCSRIARHGDRLSRELA